MIVEAWIFGFTIVGGAVLFATLGVLMVRKRVSFGSLKNHHEVAGYLLSIVGTLYSVLLGLIVVDTQTKYQDAKVMTQKEADSCLDMFHLAYSMTPEFRKKVHSALIEYMRILVHDEWESVAREGQFNESARHAYREVWWTLTDYEPTTNKQQSAYEKMLDVMRDMADGRRYRLQQSRTGLPTVLWGVLIAGGVLTVLFTYMFEVENARAHVLMTALVALALSLNVLLIALFSNPYRGYMRISCSAFVYDGRVMGELLRIRPD